MKMKGYTSTPVACTLIFVGSDGVRTRTVARKYLTQLSRGGTAPVQMGEEGEAVVDEVRTMVRVVIEFAQSSGWTPTKIRPMMVADILRELIGPESFEDIVCREDGSATVQIFEDDVRRVLKKSGISGVFLKTAASETRWMGRIEVLWLDGATLTEAMEKAAKYEGALGVARKGGRYGIRFDDKGQLRELAVLEGSERSLDLGRFRVTGFLTGAGISGVHQTLSASGWEVDDVVYVGDCHAIVEAAAAPPKGRILIRRAGGERGILHIHAVNAVARALALMAEVQLRGGDEDGDERAEVEPKKPVTTEVTRRSRAREEAEARRKALKDRSKRTPAEAQESAPTTDPTAMELGDEGACSTLQQHAGHGTPPRPPPPPPRPRPESSEGSSLATRKRPGGKRSKQGGGSAPL